MKIFVAALGSILLCACKTWHHTEKDEPEFFQEVAAADPMPEAQAKSVAAVMTEINVVMAEMPTELATEIFGKADWSGMTYGAHEAPDLDALARAHAAVDIVFHPNIKARDGVSAKISNSNRVEYVKDHEVGEKGIDRPIQGIVEEGTWFETTPRLDMTLELLDLEYTIKRTVLERPIAEKTVVLPGTNRKVTVQLPVSSTREMSGHKRLMSGQTVAIDVSTAPSSGSANRITVALITVDFWNP